MDYTILVNKGNLLDEDYMPDTLVEINEPTGAKIDVTYKNKLDAYAYQEFKLLQKEALSQGYEIFIDSSFRTYEYQKKLLKNFIESKGLNEAMRLCAPPGGSEHQTGLAIDVLVRRNNEMIEDVNEDDPELIWMRNNCYKYGYILRYPKGKEKITGYKYEPWHFRFVGIEAAMEMKKNNVLTLEEYTVYKEKKQIT